MNSKLTPKPFKFVLKHVDRIPPRIGRGQDRDPIYYPMTVEAFAACVEYYEQSERFLSGKRRSKPDIQRVLKSCVPHGSIFRVRRGRPDRFGEKLLVWIEDLDIEAEKRRCGPRWLAPEYFPAVLLLTAGGGSVRHNYTRKKDKEGNLLPRDKRKSHLSFGRGRNQNIRLLRIMAKAKVGHQIHRINARGFKDVHREYRPRALISLSDSEAAPKYGRAGYSAKGRANAIRFATQHWRSASKIGRALPERDMTDDKLVKLLEEAFSVADRLYWSTS